MQERRDQQKKKTKILKEDMEIMIDDIVLYKNTKPFKNKLDPQWVGPFVIKSILGAGSYKITDLDEKIEKICNRRQIKRIVKHSCPEVHLKEPEVSIKEGGIVSDYEKPHESITKRRKICCFGFRLLF